MRRAAFLAVLTLAMASVAVPARPIPLLGQMEISMTWSPGRPPVGGTVTFTTTASDNDGAVREARLCYGDGVCDTDSQSLSSLQLLSACITGTNWGPRQWQHRYMSAGTFKPTLTVTTRGCPTAADETRTYTASITVG